MSFEAFVDRIIQDQIQFRRRLHQMAELSGEEEKTAQAVIDFLRDTSPDHIIENIGGQGLVAVYDGEQEGPSVMIRSELDALPIREENEFDHRSAHENISHKCGHDGHMSIVCGVGRYLAEQRPQKGSVMLLFQPAEETGRGAQRMLDDPAFESFKPDYFFALHNLPGFPKHQIIVRDGVFAAASRGLILRLVGQTSHAAHPKDGRSPALAISQMLSSLSAIPQFYTSLDESVKVTPIYNRLGEKAFGTSPGSAEIGFTLRTYENEQMEILENRALALAKGIADTYELEMEYEWTEPFQATVNRLHANDIIRAVAKDCDFECHEREKPFAWSEDVGRFLDRYEGALFGLGAGRQHPQLHASNYDFPDEISHTGVRMFLEILNRLVDLNAEAPTQ